MDLGINFLLKICKEEMMIGQWIIVIGVIAFLFTIAINNKDSDTHVVIY